MLWRYVGAEQYLADLAEWKCLAEQGIDAVQFSLGVRYDNDKGKGKGKGVIPDPVNAHMCFNLAAVNGDEDAREIRCLLAKLTTPKAISKAQDPPRECVQNNFKDC